MSLQQARNSALAFLLAARRSFEHRPTGIGRTEMLLVPGVVCAAFSVELSFKTMILAAGGTPARGKQGHDLATLFSQLTKPEQVNLIARLGLERVSFAPLLDNVTDAFVKWRYIYEYQEAELAQEFLYNLAEAAYDCMLHANGT